MITIRTFEKDDPFDELISLSRDFFEEYETHHKDFFKIDFLSDDDIVNYFTHLREAENSEVILALDGDMIVGYITVSVKTQASYWQIKRVGAISGLMVARAYRRRGIASKLLTQAKDFFARLPVKYFTVYTSQANRGAIEFYERN